MTQRFFTNKRTILVATGVTALLTLAFAESGAAAQGRKQRDDARTCESFGTAYGTPAFTDCMLKQQRRRDTKQRNSLEESAMLSQLARDGQIMADRARRQRCDRKPERRECGPR